MLEIELEKRQAEIDAAYELARARIKKECEEAKTKAEQKLLNRSERCLSASSRGNRSVFNHAEGLREVRRQVKPSST